MELIILSTEERDGVVYQLCVVKVEASTFVAGGPETVEQRPVVIARKALE